MDTRLSRLTQKFGGTYSRYADDMTFSFKTFTSATQQIFPLIRKILHDYGYAIQKKKKIRILRKHQRQTVTGLIVNEKINLPRVMRRKIRAMQDYAKKGRLLSEKKDSLIGYENLEQMIVRQRN